MFLICGALFFVSSTFALPVDEGDSIISIFNQQFVQESTGDHSPFEKKELAKIREDLENIKPDDAVKEEKEFLAYLCHKYPKAAPKFTLIERKVEKIEQRLRSAAEKSDDAYKKILAQVKPTLRKLFRLGDQTEWHAIETAAQEVQDELETHVHDNELETSTPDFKAYHWSGRDSFPACLQPGFSRVASIRGRSYHYFNTCLPHHSNGWINTGYVMSVTTACCPSGKAKCTKTGGKYSWGTNTGDAASPYSCYWEFVCTPPPPHVRTRAPAHLHHHHHTHHSHHYHHSHHKHHKHHNHHNHHSHHSHHSHHNHHRHHRHHRHGWGRRR